MRLLRGRDFRSFWLGPSISLLGDHISSIAPPLVAVLVLVTVTAAFAVVFRLWPELHAWNLRFLPFWYLGVFLLITNDSDDEEFAIADEFAVTDASGRIYEPLESESPYALEPGATIAADGAIPVADTTAAAGPIQGAMLLFLVDDDVSEERPLELEIDAPEGTGIVELDI